MQQHVLIFESVTLSQIQQIIDRILKVCIEINSISHSYNQYDQAYSLVIMYHSDVKLADDFFDSIVNRKEN